MYFKCHDKLFYKKKVNNYPARIEKNNNIFFLNIINLGWILLRVWLVCLSELKKERKWCGNNVDKYRIKMIDFDK